MLYKFLTSDVDASLGPRQVRVVASDATIDRTGDVLIPGGCDLTDYRGNPIVLADHDPTQPIGTADASLRNNRIEAVINFAPAGISEKADTYCGLMKSNVLRTVSVGFKPLDAEPRKGGGITYKRWQLLELSIVAVPANPAAIVIGRAHKAGRVLSGANAMKLQQAHDAAESCRALVADVLGVAAGDDEGRAKRLRDLDFLKVTAPAPLTRSERMAVARELDLAVLKRCPW
jgi:HK97 family phage prohead protease